MKMKNFFAAFPPLVRWQLPPLLNIYNTDNLLLVFSSVGRLAHLLSKILRKICS